MRRLKLFLKALLIFLWMTISGASLSLLSPKGVNFEVAALMYMKREMRDSGHVLDGWDINSVDPCTWNMVGCSDEGFVVSLEMGSMGLSGTLSRSIGDLTHLRTMLIQNNQLTGILPVEVGKLTELQTLDVSGNQFGGEIPSSLGYLTHLTYLRLSKNKLTGQIPAAIANLTGLSFLDLSFNNLSGPIPKILVKDYSIAGNMFLCSSFSQLCMAGQKPANETDTYSKVSNHHRMVIALIVGVSCALVISIVILVYWLHWYRSRVLYASHVQQDYEFNIGTLKRFSFRELLTATSNFSSRNIVGEGGFGVVYKGYLPNRTVVAVKRFKNPSFSGDIQFQTEVEIIGMALHCNLLRLYGFCMTPEEKLLVYPYMPNGSVADRLRENAHKKPCLDWSKRMHIAVGASRGLVYLHEQCNPKIIHRDVKAANILLDASFEAVVGDFGLAKLLDPRDSHVTTAVRGTVGHIAPEYLSTGKSSEKTDVFGFGTLLLELVTGQKALDAANVHVQRGLILDWVRTLYEERKLEEVVDKNLNGHFKADELEKVVELVLQCTQSNPDFRPKMSQVLKILEGISGQREAAPQGPTLSFSLNLGQDCRESSFVIEAVELSGPR